MITTSKKRKASRPWVPARQDIIWIDCNLQAGQEMRDVHPISGAFSSQLQQHDIPGHWPAHDDSGIQCRQPICRCHRAGQRSKQGRKNQLRTLPPAQNHSIGVCAVRERIPSRDCRLCPSLMYAGV